MGINMGSFVSDDQIQKIGVRGGGGGGGGGGLKELKNKDVLFVECL